MPKQITTNALFYSDHLSVARGTFKKAECVIKSDAEQGKLEL